MANSEHHIKDFYDAEEAYQWLADISAEYDPDNWTREPQIRLISNGTIQVMVSFFRIQRELFEDEDFVDDYMDSSHSRNE